MIKITLKIIILATGLSLVGLSFADTVAQNKPQNTTETNRNIVYCPPIKDIKKDPASMTWKDKLGFKSYNQSFANALKFFIGAQWTGANVGQITCIYKGDDENTFPVLLIYHTLALEPKGANWGSNMGGYRNCAAKQQKNCPFIIRLKPKQQDIYQEAEKLKSGDTNDTEPGF